MALSAFGVEDSRISKGILPMLGGLGRGVKTAVGSNFKGLPKGTLKTPSGVLGASKGALSSLNKVPHLKPVALGTAGLGLGAAALGNGRND